MPKVSRGYLFRRRNGKYLPLDADPTAVIHYERYIAGRRVVFSLMTADLEQARAMAAKVEHDPELREHRRTLLAIIAQGERARAELAKCDRLLLGRERAHEKLGRCQPKTAGRKAASR